MCGIFGTVNFGDFRRENVEKSLYHRGPDEQNWFESENITLFHARLAIQDLSPMGRQPMVYKQYTIIFNGEIYNHAELRSRYNLNCNSSSDTETILHLYDLLGMEMLNLFDGMFAFVIYDSIQRKLILARDRAGKKPVYLYSDSSKLVFASELNAIKSVLPLKIDNDHIHEYLRLGYFYKQSTPYQDIQEVEAGTYQIIDLNTLSFQKVKWWDIRERYLLAENEDFETTLEKTNQYLRKSVKNRLISSDLEVGSFLSGGIDSGLVTAVASEFTSKLKTFTVSFDGVYDEAPLARLVAQRYATNHTEISISFDSLKYDVEKIIASYGEPFADSSAIPSYYVSMAAKKHLTVILNGDGGDELFGGYRRHVLFNQVNPWNDAEFIKNALKGLYNILPHSNNKKSLYNYFHRLVFLKSRKDIVDIYLATTSDIFEGYQQYLLGNLEVERFSELRNSLSSLNGLPLSSLQKLMIADFENILFGDLLVKMDIATMQHSLEGRSPFLSRDILNYIPTIKDNYKIKGKNSKYILRTLAGKYLPQDLINQPKRGFEIPLKNWVNSILKEPIADYINSNKNFSDDFIDKKFMIDLLNGHVEIGDEKRAKILWCVFCLNVWYKKVYC